MERRVRRNLVKKLWIEKCGWSCCNSHDEGVVDGMRRCWSVSQKIRL